MAKLSKARQEAVITSYNNSYNVTLDNVYNSYSHAKYNAFMRCINDMYNMHGWNFKIISYNSNMFTCGYTYQVDNVYYLRYHTKSYVYDIKLD